MGRKYPHTFLICPAWRDICLKGNKVLLIGLGEDRRSSGLAVVLDLRRKGWKYWLTNVLKHEVDLVIGLQAKVPLMR